MVLSCAGSNEAWQGNEKYKIINYALFASIIAGKIKGKDTSIANLEEIVEKSQRELLKVADSEKVYEMLKMGDFTIEFPNLILRVENITSMNINTLNVLPKIEKSVFDCI